MQDWIEAEKFDSNFALKTRDNLNNFIKNNSLQSSTDYKSTTGKNALQYDLTKYINHLEIFKEITAVTTGLLKNKNIIGTDKKLEIVSAWTVLGSKGTYHRIHKHNSDNVKDISTVFYIDVENALDDLSGCFYAVLKVDDIVDHIEFSPELGDFLIFPTWILHGTYPQQSERRQSLNIDFAVI